MDKYSVPEDKRKKLGQFIKNKRIEKKLGHNQLSVKIDIQKSLLSRLENGLILKINPFMLKKVAAGLDIDYKELYKIIGYLETNDFTIVNNNEIYHEELEKLDLNISLSKEKCEEYKNDIRKYEDFLDYLEALEKESKKLESDLKSESPELRTEFKELDPSSQISFLKRHNKTKLLFSRELLKKEEMILQLSLYLRESERNKLLKKKYGDKLNDSENKK